MLRLRLRIRQSEGAVYNHNVKQAEHNWPPPEPLAVKLECAAHHEAGHIVAAVAQGLKLRPEGIIVDSCGEGLACYCRKPDGSDILREHIIVATFAGFYAEMRFRQEHGYAIADPEEWFLNSCDGREARGLLSELAIEHLSNGNVPETQLRLCGQSEKLVEQHWAVVKSVATALLAKDYEDWKPLKSGMKLSSAKTARYLAGEEVVRVLAPHRLIAICDLDC